MKDNQHISTLYIIPSDQVPPYSYQNQFQEYSIGQKNIFRSEQIYRIVSTSSSLQQMDKTLGMSRARVRVRMLSFWRPNSPNIQDGVGVRGNDVLYFQRYLTVALPSKLKSRIVMPKRKVRTCFQFNGHRRAKEMGIASKNIFYNYKQQLSALAA